MRIASAVGQAVDAAQAEPDPAVQGKRLFTVNCAACHQQSGKGVAGQFPPLAASEWVLGEPAVLIRILLHGLQGPVMCPGRNLQRQHAGLRCETRRSTTVAGADLHSAKLGERSRGNHVPSGSLKCEKTKRTEQRPGPPKSFRP